MNDDSLLDLIYAFIDNLMWESKWQEIDKWINNWISEYDELTAVVKIAILSATLPAKSKLINRNQFYKLCKQEFDHKTLYGLE